MGRIAIVMLAFGLAIGLVFPLVVGPFVNWVPGRKLYFQLACLSAGFAVGGFCYYLVRVTLYERNNLLSRRKAELEAAKSRFSDLAATAISQRDWDISMQDTHIPTCWEVKDCGRDECPCFGKEKIRCWLVDGTYCGGEIQENFARKVCNCSRCEVYKKAVECDPINEIGENFNNLMWAVKEREEELSEAKNELHQQYTQLKELQRQTKEASVTDTLTGLRNHGHFQQHLEAEVKRAERYSRPLSLVMLDLDFFKSINDKCGHQKGDRVLSGVGRFLDGAIRDVDYAARYGGEEFVVVMPETDGDSARAVAERLRTGMKQIAVDVGLPEECVAGSFGVADLPACASDASSLLAAADSALLFSKSQGRDRVAYFRDLSDTQLQDRDLEGLNSRFESANMHTICSLAEAVAARDYYAGAETNNLSAVAAAMAAELGMEQNQAEILVLATALHDIGKIGVPDSVLNKKDKLEPDEIEMVQQHPEMGRKIMQEAQQIQEIQELVSAILYHHERWDGKGYPEGLKGEEIPLMARIVGVFDAYRAMAADRPYRKALPTDQIVRELRKGAGGQFDPELVEVFINIMDEGGIGQAAEAG